MLTWLTEFENLYGPMRLFGYVTFRAGGALFTSMLLTLLFGPMTVRLLKKFSAVAPTRLEGLIPEEFIDREKDKTPSMGGILIVLSIIISSILWADLNSPLVVIFMVLLASLSLLGFYDDYCKIAHNNKDGISSKLKLLLQIIISVTAVYFLHNVYSDGYLQQIIIPFFKAPLELGAYSMVIAFALGVLTVIGSSNAVNLTDGKDGLAIGCVIFCTLTYAIIAYFCGHSVFAEHLNIPFIPDASEVVVIAAALVGSGIGFLWHNCYPASMFMGDTGSLALGGVVGLIAVLVRQEFVLILVGGVFVMEAASVIIQVASFKLTGKRVFLCAPIHHHFERKGWTETQIIVRFWILAGVFALLGLATLKLR